MAISKVSIANKALTEVGATPITALDDETNNARIVNRVYEISLKSILSECKWNFATKRALLSVSSDTLAWYDTGETVVYTKPADMIRIFGVSYRPAIWREEGDYIISDTSSLGVRYVYYLDEPTKYSISFVEAFIDKLCSDVAYMIVNSKSLGDKFLEVYESLSLPKALSENSQTGQQQEILDDAWIRCKTQNSQANV